MSTEQPDSRVRAAHHLREEGEVKSKDGRYEVRYWRWHVDNHDMSTDSLQEALCRALALDDEFDEGYHGISFIYDTETKRRAGVGNGALRDKEHSTDSLEWKEDTP